MCSVFCLWIENSSLISLCLECYCLQMSTLIFLVHARLNITDNLPIKKEKKRNSYTVRTQNNPQIRNQVLPRKSIKSVLWGGIVPIEFHYFRVCYRGNVTTQPPSPVDLTLRENFSLSFVPELLNGLSQFISPWEMGWVTKEAGFRGLQ